MADALVMNLAEEHPRVRGENQTYVEFNLDEKGTSPRARGKPVTDPQEEQPERNIPACAGKTNSGP